MKFEVVAEDFNDIITELYDSENAISEEKINSKMQSLCDFFGVDKDVLRNGLCVKHYRH